MLVLAMVWLVGGALVGALALLAAVAPTVWWHSQRRSGWGMIALGALTALLGGLLGVLLLGRLFASAMASWTAVLAVALIPRAIARFRRSPTPHPVQRQERAKWVTCIHCSCHPILILSRLAVTAVDGPSRRLGLANTTNSAQAR